MEMLLRVAYGSDNDTLIVNSRVIDYTKKIIFMIGF